MAETIQFAPLVSVLWCILCYKRITFLKTYLIELERGFCVKSKFEPILGINIFGLYF